MTIYKKFLVVKANGEMKLASPKSNRPKLESDEIAVPIVVHIPDAWGTVYNDQIDIGMPGPPGIDPIGDMILPDDEGEGDGD